MNLTPPKLKPLHIGIITALLFVLIAGALGYFWVLPIKQQNDQLASEVQTLQDQGSPDKLAGAKADKEKAKVFAVRQQHEYRLQEAKYFRVGPNRKALDVSNSFAALQELSLEQHQTLGPIIERWVTSSGNRLASRPTIAPAPTNPNALSPDVIPVEVKGVRVTGTFPSMMRLLRSTRQLSRLMTIQSVSLTQAGGGDVTQGMPAFDTVSADLGLMVWIFPTPGKTRGNFTMPRGANTGGGGGMMAPAAPMGAPMAAPMPGAPAGAPPMPGGPMPPPPPG